MKPSVFMGYSHSDIYFADPSLIESALNALFIFNVFLLIQNMIPVSYCEMPNSDSGSAPFAQKVQVEYIYTRTESGIHIPLWSLLCLTQTMEDIPMHYNEFLTTKQVAAWFQVSRYAIYGLRGRSVIEPKGEKI